MKHLRASIGLTFFFIVGFGLLFPAAIYGISQLLFPFQAGGSLIKGPNGQIIGSSLLAQGFTKPQYFHPRPSAAGNGYDAANSGATNLGPTSDKLINGVKDPKNPSNNFDGVKDLAKAYREENGYSPTTVIPVDAVTRSASGLDPDISIDNATLQAGRVAKARNMTVNQVIAVINAHTQGRFLGLYGEPRVNVLELNLALDKKA